MRYELFNEQGEPTGEVVLADEAFMAANYPTGMYRLEVEPPAPVPEPPVYSTYIDLGPFYDRFKSAKLAVLTSNDPGVKAIIADLNIRKWVDLVRPDVASALQYVGTQVPALTAELQTEILTTPVQDHENLALRKLYFS